MNEEQFTTAHRFFVDAEPQWNTKQGEYEHKYRSYEESLIIFSNLSRVALFLKPPVQNKDQEMLVVKTYIIFKYTIEWGLIKSINDFDNHVQGASLFKAFARQKYGSVTARQIISIVSHSVQATKLRELFPEINVFRYGCLIFDKHLKVLERARCIVGLYSPNGMQLIEDTIDSLRKSCQEN